jgi:glycosyltransferase involved in cell wall biosynthesis
MSEVFLKLSNISNVQLTIITQANSEYETLPVDAYTIGRLLFKSARHLYFVSKRNEVVAQRQLAFDFNNSSVISNPANLKEYEICKWNVAKTVNMAFAGRLNSSVKGLGVLLQILSEKKWQERDWCLNLYGRGEDEDYLKELARYYKLEAKVHFRGFVADVHSIWRENHVLVMPSTLEGTPLTLIEAMLCGRTAVVSDVGGNAELVSEGESGFVAEAPSLHSFGNALERMWIQKEDLKSIGCCSAESIKNKINLLSFKEIIDNL